MRFQKTLIKLSTLLLVAPTFVGAEPIQVADVTLDQPVDFSTQILPVLRKKCLACHNQTDAESDLILENPKAMLKGGSEGPSIVPGNADESYMFKLAAHVDEPVMPPEDNEVDAANLTPKELGLLKLWINQGAKEGSKADSKIEWQPLPPGANPVFAVATSFDGKVVAAGRANQIFMNFAASDYPLGRLTDPSLVSGGVYTQPGVAHLDMVQSLAFSPDNEWLASGGYRTVKLWKRSPSLVSSAAIDSKGASAVISMSEHTLIGFDNGSIRQVNSTDGKTIATYQGHSSKIVGLVPLSTSTFVSGSSDGALVVWQLGKAEPMVKNASGPSLGTLFKVAGNRLAAVHEKVIRIWTCDQATPVESLKIEVDQPIVAAATAGSQIVVGTKNGDARLLGINDGKEARRVAHGAEITQVAMSSDGSKIVTGGVNGIVKVWNSADGKMQFESKSDLQLETTYAMALYERDVAKRQVNNAKSDLDAAAKRQKQEEDNLKKAEEKKKKAEEEKKKKDDAVKKASEESKTAQAKLKDFETKIANESKTTQNAEKQIASTKNAFDQTLVTLTKQLSSYEQLAAEVVTQQAEHDKAKIAFDADKNNADLKSSFEKSTAALKAAKGKLQAADDARVKVFEQSAQAKKQLDDSKNGLVNAKKEIEAAKKGLDAAKKAATDKSKAAEKATNEQKDAQRTLESAVTSIDQAKKAIVRAKELNAKAKSTHEQNQKVAQAKEATFKAAEAKRNSYKNQISKVAVTKDGKFVVVANGQAIQLLTIPSGQIVRRIPVETVGVTSVLDANRMVNVTESSLQTLDLLPSWKLAKTIGSAEGDSIFADRITSLAFSPDSKNLAVGGGQPSRSGELKILKVADASIVKDLADTHSDTVLGIAYSPSGDLLATCAADRFMKVSDVATGKVVKTFEGHTHHVLSVSWQADGRVLATGGADKVVKIWNYREGSQIKTISGFGKEVTSLQHFGPNDAFVAVSGDQSIYSCNQGGQRNGIGKANDFIYSVSVSRIGNLIAYAGHDSIVRVIDEKGKVISSLEPPK